MPNTTYHVIPRGDEWAVKREGSDRSSRITESQDEAIDLAEDFARHQRPARVVIHDSEGRIETQREFERGGRSSDSGSFVTHPAFILGVGLAVGLVGLTVFAARSDWGRSKDWRWSSKDLPWN